MHRLTHDLMLDHVRAIYHAITGTELPELKMPAPLPPGPEAVDFVAARFAELEAFARLIPAAAARVPPFAFAPQIDVVDRTKEFVVEVALPGVDRESVEAKVVGETLVISGVREWDARTNHRVYRHAEIPRGPFLRVLTLPPDVSGEPMRVEMTNGIMQIRLNKIPLGPVAKA